MCTILLMPVQWSLLDTARVNLTTRFFFGAVAEWCRALGFIDEGRMFEPTSGHYGVFLGKTLYSDFLSPPRCMNGYLILFRIGEGKCS